MDKTVTILLTNDDGFHAPGIKHLFLALQEKYNVIVVAPATQMSGVGHGFTYQKPLGFSKQPFYEFGEGYSVNGTPSDCVKIAIGHILSKKPDFVVSGINNGGNTGVASYYSGTIAAAREGAFWQIPSMAFSLYEQGEEYYSEYTAISVRLFEHLIIENKANNYRNRIFFNVNYPLCKLDDCSGVKYTRQSLSFYNDIYTEKINKNGEKEYWLHGEREDMEQSLDFDAFALDNNFITVTPMHFDATSDQFLSNKIELKNIL